MILVFSDIHANKKAAREIIKLSKSFKDIICCGDICGYGKDFKYCIDMCKDLNIKAVLGNHDKLVVDSKISLSDYPKEIAGPIERTRKKIKDKDMIYLMSLPVEINFRDIYITHTTSFDNYITTDKDYAEINKKTTLKTILIGHTHIQEEYHINDTKIINPGSITKSRKRKQRGYVVIDGDEVNFHKRKAIL